MASDNETHETHDIPWLVIIICITCVSIFLIGTIAFLVALNKDLTEFRAMLNTVANIITIPLSSTAAIYAGAASKRSGKAVEQTNGSLDKRIADGTYRAVARLMIDRDNNG